MITPDLLPYVMSKSLALRVRCALHRATAADDLVVAEAPLLEALGQSATTDHRRLARLIATLGTDERPQRLPTFRFLCDWAFLADASLSGVVAMSAGLLLWVEEALMGSAASVEFFDLFDDTPDVWQGGHAIDVLSVSPPLITPRAFAWRPRTESIQRRDTEETPLEERRREGGDRRGEFREHRLGLCCRAPAWPDAATAVHVAAPGPRCARYASARPVRPGGRRARRSRLGPPKRQNRLGSRAVDSGLIEVEIDGVVVRVGRGAEAKTVAAVLRALRVPS